VTYRYQVAAKSIRSVRMVIHINYLALAPFVEAACPGAISWRRTVQRVKV